MNCGSFGTCVMGGVAHCVDATGIDPAIVEIEQGADRNGIVDGLVREAGLVENRHILRLNIDGIFIYFSNKPEEGFVGFGERAGFDVLDNSSNELVAVQ
jgi:hypothetical protein